MIMIERVTGEAKTWTWVWENVCRDSVVVLLLPSTWKNTPWLHL